MIVYFAATAVTLVFAALALQYKERLFEASKYILPRDYSHIFKMLAVLTAVPLTIVSVIRYDVGTDYISIFRNGFLRISSGGTMPSWEFGFMGIIRTILLFSSDYVWLFAIMAVLTSFFTFKAIYRLSNNVVLSILLYVLGEVYFFSLNGVRQGLSIAIFLCAIKYIQSRQFIKYALMIVLAASMHFSAVILITFYWLYAVKITPKVAMITLMVSATLLPFINAAFRAIVSMTRYAWYIGSIFDTTDWSLSDLIMAVPILATGYYFYHRATDNKLYGFLLNLQTLSLIIAIYSSQIFLVFRLNPYFTATQMFLVPLIISMAQTKKAKILLTIFFISLFTIYFVWGFLIIGWHDVFPYQTIFSRN